MRTGWQSPQSNQLFPLTPMLSSRLIGRSESVAVSPVSQAAWRGCIDNIPACKAQSIPWGAQQQVDEESPDGLLAPQLDTAAEEEI